MNFPKILTDGLWGFAAFFSIIFIIKLNVYLFGFSASLNIEVMDIYHSLIGFALFLLSRISKKLVNQ